MRLLILLLTALVCARSGGASAQAGDPDQVIGSWLAGQTNIQTWAADFKQTRTLKALAQPLVSTGQVWFAAPRNFRWELGGDQTIAIRHDDAMMVVYPRLKRAEKYQFSEESPNQWRDTLALLQSGFPNSRAQFDDQFKLLSLSETNGLYQLALEPRSAGARKLLPRIHLLLDADALALAGTELVFVDGSRMRNEFLHIRTNVPVEGRFEFEIPPGFKVIEPLKEKR